MSLGKKKTTPFCFIFDPFSSPILLSSFCGWCLVPMAKEVLLWGCTDPGWAKRSAGLGRIRWRGDKEGPTVMGNSEMLQTRFPVDTTTFPRWFQLHFPQWLLCTASVGPNPNPPFRHPKDGNGSNLAGCDPTLAASLEGLCHPTSVCNEEISKQALKWVLNAKLCKLLLFFLCCNSTTASKFPKVKCCYSTALRILLTNVIWHYVCDASRIYQKISHDRNEFVTQTSVFLMEALPFLLMGILNFWWDVIFNSLFFEFSHSVPLPSV